MMNVDSSIVYNVRQRFPVGTVVELVRMMDRNAPPIGTRGTVLGVDNNGTIAVRWDNGTFLGIVYGEDKCRIIEKRRKKYEYT